MFVVDTNVLIYAADEKTPEHNACRSGLQAWRRSAAPFYLTWTIVYEFLRVTTHPGVLRYPRSAHEAWEFISSVLEAPSCSVLIPTENHSRVLAQTLTEMGPVLRGNILHDTHTAVLMREHGVRRIVTRDAHFHRFSFLEVVDPLTTG